MADDDRLIHSSDLPIERAIFRAGAEETAPPAVCRRALGALGLLVVAPPAAAASSGTAVGSGTAKLFGAQAWGTKLGLLLALGGTAGGVGYGLASQSSEPGDIPSTSVQAPTQSRPVTDVASESKGKLDSAPEVENQNDGRKGVSVPIERSVRRRTEQKHRTPFDEASVGALRAEVALLDRAREALDRGETEKALSVLGDYFARHPRGELREEALEIRAKAALIANGAK